MIIFTTLKQKDLAAVSAQQMFDHHFPNGNGPKQINRYIQFEIIGDFSEADLLNAISSTYIFANPNKHHLIASIDSFNSKNTYINVARKSPLNLTSKVISLSKVLNDSKIDAVYESELWSFQYNGELNIEEITNQFVTSSPTNKAPFAHPHIHSVTPTTFEILANQLYFSKTQA